MTAISLLLGVSISILILYPFLVLSEGYVQGVATNCTSLTEASGMMLPLNARNSADPQPCFTIDDAMDALVSDSSIILEQGIHVVTQSHSVYSLQNIVLSGIYERGVYLMCEDQVGLSFINITGLTIANLTVHGCGLLREGLQSALNTLKETVDVWSVIPSSIRVALFLGHCRDLTVINVNINGTRGLGMLAINVVGNSALSYVKFTHNIRRSCISQTLAYPFDITPQVFDQIGGGAYFLYHDYLNEPGFDLNSTLQVSNSYFAYNADCSFSTLTHVYYQYFDTEINRYTIGAAGGLTILYAHSNYSLTTEVEFTTFYRNDARYGSGAYVGVFADNRYPNRVIFNKCSFMENGLASAASEGGLPNAYCHGGAGLGIFTDLLKPVNLLEAISNVQNIYISVLNTTFIRNEAEIEGGGIYAYSLVNSPHRVNSHFLNDYRSIEWRLTNCVFQQNRARLSSAAAFVQRVFHSIDGIVILYLESVRASRNSLGLSFGSIPVDNEISSTVSVQNVLTVFQGNSVFADNDGSALYVVSSSCLILPGAELAFERNVGRRGGAIYLGGFTPGFFVQKNFSLIFRENVALVEGGAIFYGASFYASAVQLQGYFGCLFSTSTLEVLTSGTRIEFYNNRAPVGGVAFGTTLELCPWARELDFGAGTLFVELFENLNSTFVFDELPVGKEQVSTYASSIHVNAPQEVIPGQVVDVRIDVFDQFGSEIFAVVTAEASNDLYASSVILGESGFWYTGLDNATMQILGPQNQIINVTFYTYINVVQASVEVNLLSCPAGFIYNNKTSACECNQEIFEPSDSQIVSCDSLSITVSTTSEFWFGTDLNSVNSMDYSDLITHHDCHFDYCRDHTTFRPPDYDAQCAVDSHRTGVLCGACSSGYSAVFGTSKCKICTNYFLFLILVFAMVGILVFLGIAFLEITIDKGWINAVLFYCNVVSLYSFLAFPNNSKLRLFLLPVHLLSLEVGFSLCFFDGMTALSRAFIQLLFPLYLYLLMGIFKLIAQRYSLSCYFSPVKTFVTLNILSYVSLLNTCVEILAGHTVHYVAGERSSRWLIDANQLYFRGWHAALGVCAFVLIIGHLGSFTVIILFPARVYKFFESGKPFFDAIYAPYKPKYRFWAGIRLIALAMLIAHVKFIITTTSLVVNLVLLMTLLHAQMSIQPYKSKWLNVVDSYLICNAVILYVGALAKTQVPSSSSILTKEVLFAFFFFGVAYVVIICIFGHYIDMRFPKIRERLMKCIVSLWMRDKKVNNKAVPRVTLEERCGVSTTSFTVADYPSAYDINPPSRRKLQNMTEVPHYRDSILDTI